MQKKNAAIIIAPSLALVLLPFFLAVNAQSTGTDSILADLHKRLTPGEWELLKEHSSTRSPLEIIGMILPWLTTIFAVFTLFKQQQWQKKRDWSNFLFQGLSWFEGKTQHRSIGIAVVEASWDQDQSLHKVWTSVIVNQAIYLLLKSDSLDSPHEMDNLYRLMELITGKAALTPTQVGQITDALAKKIKAQGKVPGLNLSPDEHMQALGRWFGQLTGKYKIRA